MRVISPWHKQLFSTILNGCAVKPADGSCLLRLRFGEAMFQLDKENPMARKALLTRKTLCAILVLLILGCVPVMAALASDQYQVSSEIRLNGKAFASPGLVVQAGANGSVSIKGDKGYVLRVSVQPFDGAGKARAKLLDLKYSLQTEAGYIDTDVVAQAGRKLVISSGVLHVTVTVTPTPL